MDLPPEILHIIFSFCSVTDLLESLQYVCQKWHEAVLSPWVWRKRILNVSRHEKSEELKSVLIQLPFLKNVLMQGVNSEALTLLSENCPLLEYLRLHDCEISVFLHINNRISQFSCLTYIDVRFQRMSCVENILSLNQNCGFPPLLHTIIFRKAISKGGLLFLLLQTCKFLRRIVISHTNNLESFLESSLKNSGFTDKTEGHHTLHTFYMSRLIIPNAAEEYIPLLKKISEFPNLKYLALKCNQFCNNEILQTIFKKPHPDLLYLDLGYSFNLTRNAFDSVLNLCPNLVYLSLERCCVMDSTVSLILSVVCKLQYLNLHGTFVSSQCFPSIPVKLPNLKDLNVRACRHIDKGVLMALASAMPNLIIVLPRKGILKGALVTERIHSFLEHRNSLDFSYVRYVAYSKYRI